MTAHPELPKSNRRLRLTLCDYADPTRELGIDFRILDTPIAMRWSDMLVFFSQRGATVAAPERFSNFPNDTKGTDAWLLGELQRCIDGVNRYHPGHIDLRLDGRLEQATLNELHERFAHGKELDPAPVEPGQPVVIRDREAWERCRAAAHAHSGLDLQPTTGTRQLVDAIADHPDFGAIKNDYRNSLYPEEPPKSRTCSPLSTSPSTGRRTRTRTGLISRAVVLPGTTSR